MGMNWPHRALALFILVQAIGCTGGYLSPTDSQTLTSIKVGMTREEVLNLLGSPYSQETVGKTELLTYRPDWSIAGATNFSPIGIVDGKVAGWGPAYDLKVKQDFKAAAASK